jgi:hypothetical protein
MIQLSRFPDDAKFYRGTIIVLKGIMNTPGGIFDARYAMISQYAGMGNLLILNIHKSIGSITMFELKPNVEGHHAVDKAGIRGFVDEYFKTLYTEEGYKEWSAKIDEITFIEDLDDYFTQTNRDIFV